MGNLLSKTLPVSHLRRIQDLVNLSYMNQSSMRMLHFRRIFWFYSGLIFSPTNMVMSSSPSPQCHTLLVLVVLGLWVLGGRHGTYSLRRETDGAEGRDI